MVNHKSNEPCVSKHSSLTELTKTDRTSKILKHRLKHSGIDVSSIKFKQKAIYNSNYGNENHTSLKIE